jgi:hypothetical protein
MERNTDTCLPRRSSSKSKTATPILLAEFLAQVHPFPHANKDKISKCEDEIYTRPTQLRHVSEFVGIDPAEFKGFDRDKEQPTEPSLFTRSGNIPAGCRFLL